MFIIFMAFVLLFRPPGTGYYDEHDGVSVCLSVREHISGTTYPLFTKFCACYLRLGLGALSATSRYVTYFRFKDDVMFAHKGQQ